jgi:hypothetical protein
MRLEAESLMEGVEPRREAVAGADPPASNQAFSAWKVWPRHTVSTTPI